MSKGFKACIFDLDGVLVDTAKYHYKAWSELAASLGFFLSIEDNERLKGVSRMASLDIVLSIGGIGATSAEKERFAAGKNARYVELISSMNPDEILPGVRKFLRDLKRREIPVALASASKNAAMILDAVGIRGYFDAVADGNNTSKAKPDPEVFLAAASGMGIDPKDCVGFEDAVAGVEAVLSAGMFCIGVGKPDILARADLVIPGFEGFALRNLRC